MADSAINKPSADGGTTVPRIASIGDNCVDVYVGDEDARFPGGNALNVAALSSIAGLRAAYLGAVGDDAEGNALLAAARAARVDVSGVLRLDGPTGVTTVRLRGGEREFVSEEYGISLSFVVDSAVVDRLRGFDWVHLARVPDGPAAELAKTGTSVSRDFGTDLRDREPEGPVEAGGLAVAFFSAADRISAQAEAAALLEAGAGLAVGTIGAEGAIAVGADVAHHEPALARHPIDTLGAGDAFIAGFIGARLRGADLASAMRSGAEAAAETCARLGAWGALNLKEVSR